MTMTMTMTLSLAVLGALLPAGARPLFAQEGRKPPCMRLELAEVAPVIGVDLELPVRVHQEAGIARAGEVPRLFASVGRIAVHAAGEGRPTVARYTLPSTRFPQVALLAAETASGCRTTLAVKLRAPATPTFRTDPGASVTVRVADRDFGPVAADERGQVRVAVIVPPGVRTALARSTNSAGRVSEQPLDLAPPPFNRVLVLAPPAVTAGEVREIAVAGVEVDGRPVEPGRLVMVSSGPRPQPLGGEPGLARFLVRAPTAVHLGDGRLRLTAVIHGEPDTETEVALPLAPGPVATLAIRASRSRLPAAANLATDVFVIARDRHGNAASAEPAAVYVNGRRAGTRSLGDGRIATQVSAHEALAGQRHVEVEAVLSPAYSRQLLPVARPGERRQFEAPADEPALHLTPRLGINMGQAARPGLAVGVAGSTRTGFLPAALELGLDLAYLRTRFDVSDSLGGLAKVGLDQLLGLCTVAWRFRPHPQAEVVPEAGLGLAVVRARTRDRDHILEGRDLAPALALGVAAGTPAPHGALILAARYLITRPGGLSNGDHLEGNAAGLVLELGYRVGL